MSIESEIERIENNISDAYDAMEAAGAEIPTDRNSNNLTMTVSNALSNSAGQAYRKLTESLYNEAITYGTYDGKTIENGEIFTAYDGTFKKYTSEISGVTRGDTYETFGTFPDTSSTTGPGYLAYGNGILVASYTGNIPYWISSDNGQTWQKIENSNKVSNVVRFYNGYFYTSLKSNNINKLHKSEDAINWTPVSSDARFISYILNDTFVANYAYSKDYGVTWTNFPISTSGRSDLAFNNVVDNTYFCSFTNNSTSTFHLYWTEDFVNWNDISSFADNATRVDAICKFNNTYYMWYGYDEYTSHCILVTSTDRLNWTYVATYTNWANTLGYSGTVVLSYPNYTIQNNNSSSSTSSTPEMLEEGVVTKLSYHRGVLILNDYMYFIYGKTNNEQTFIGYPIIASYSRQCTSLSYNTSGVNNLIPTIDQSYSGVSTNAQSGIAVKQAVDEAISSVYKPAGSVAFSGLPTLSASYEGYVYNINEEFTTDANFVEGTGKTYPAGTNVVCIDVGSSTYKWDVLAGYIAPTYLTDLAIGSDTVKIDYPGHNFTIVGAVNIQNSIASGFADKTKYIYSNEPLPYTQQFELQIKLNTGTLVTSRNQWFCANESNTKKAVTWGIVGNTRTQRLYVTTNGSTWVNPANGTFQFQDNTDYILKLVYDGNNYTSYYSTDDGETWTADAVISRSEPLPADRPIYLGVSEEQTNCWPGSIDLSRTFMKVNGEIVWQPLRTDKSSITLNLPTNILYNNSTGADGLSIGNSSSNNGSSSIGMRATAGWVSTAVGAVATASGSESVAVGTHARSTGAGSIAISSSNGAASAAVASGVNSIAISRNAKATMPGTIQFGAGTNSSPNTIQFYDYPLFDANGKIYTDRIAQDESESLQNFTLNNGTYDSVTDLLTNITTGISAYYNIPNILCTNSFEVSGKVKVTEAASNKWQVFFSCNPDNICIGIGNSNKLFINNAGQGSDVYGTYVFTADTDVWIKATYDQTTGTMTGYYSTDGETWTQDVTNTVTPPSNLILNTFSINRQSTIYLSTWKFIVDDELVWTAFKTPEIAKATNSLYGLVKPDNTSITINNGVISTDALRNTATGSNLTIASTYATTANNAYGNINIGAASKINTGSTQIQGCIAIGQGSQGSATNGIALGRLANVTGSQSIALGFNAKATAESAVQLGTGTNAEGNTLQFRSYPLVDSSGNIPAARLGALPVNDGEYTLKLTITDGVPTLTWVSTT